MLHSRMKRVNEQVLHDLAQIINYELNDPRLQFVSVTGVNVSRDLSEATVLVSPLEDSPEAASEALEALNAAHGHIKRLLGERLSLKRLPNPHFRIDPTTKQAFHIQDILSHIEISPEEPEPAAADAPELPDKEDRA